MFIFAYMKANIEHKGKSGIYCIRNIVNNKCYVGKAKCIHKRIKTHITYLNAKNNKQENTHIINAWHKYGRDNFDYYVLEYVNLDDISERELYWIKELNTIDRTKGYNLRMDSSTGMITHKETSKKLTAALNKRFESQEARDKVSKKTKEFWKNNPEAKKEMAKKVSETKKKKYLFKQFEKDGTYIRTWDSVEEIITENPTYKWQQIYSVCNGYKPSIYGYKWSKELKI